MKQIILALIVITNLCLASTWERISIGGEDLLVLNEAYDLYDSKGVSARFYHEDEKEDLHHLLTLVLEDKTGGCLGKSIQKGTFKIKENKLIFYHLWDRSPSQKDAPYGASIEKYANSNMIGVIFVPYDDGQYSLHTNYAKANGMIGYDSNAEAKDNNFTKYGKVDIMTALFKAEGIGDGINDYLDDTIFFASYAKSITHPDGAKAMLGTTESKSGHMYWVGLQMPGLFSEDGRWGVEYNKGSKYWRSMTYGEDTIIGSKIAARGTAKEIYWYKPITKSLSLI